MSLKHDAAAALAFLRLLYPAGPWVLTSIEPDRRGIETATFDPTTEKDLVKWLGRNAPNRNIYYQVNRPLRALTKKADRTDIDAVCYLHVDIDPRAGEDIDAEHTRIRALLEAPPGGIPRPTSVVASGGGLNALWALEEPIAVRGVLEAAEEAKRYNLQLEIQLTGDNCHNIDRILRLPGTVNWPDERKRKKGRQAALAKVVWFEPTVYPIATFTPAPIVQTPGAGLGGAKPRVQVSGNLPRLSSVDELGENVKGKVKEVIVLGHDADMPNRWPSRSEPLFWVCCELVRAGISDDVIYSVLTDPDFKISSSVLDKGSGAEAYALRQIEQAREDAINPLLREINLKHAVIGNMGGKCRVIQEVNDPVMNRPRLTKQSFDDFRNRYMNRKVETGMTDKAGNPIRVPLGKWWLEHEQRKQYESLVFAPGKEVPDAYNLWRGFACQALPGTAHEGFLEHVRSNVCSGNDEYYTYVLGWMAYAVQHPDRPGEVAVVLRGKRGTGKSFFAKMFGALWGRHFLQVSDPKHLVGSFNAHLRDCVVLFGDEAFFAGDKKHESVLKTLITEETIMIEGKGQDAEWSPNYTHLIMASNDSWVVPAGTDERRYLVLDVGTDRIQNGPYFAKLRDDMEKQGGREALLHYLLNYDIRDFDVRKPPKTEALREQKILSLTSEEEWWFHKLEEGILARHHNEWCAPVLKEELLNDYLLYSAKVGIGRRSTATALGRFLKRAVPSGLQSKQAMRSYNNDAGVRMHERASYYEFPTLAACRAFWDEHFFAPAEWLAVDTSKAGQPKAPF